MNKYPLVSIIIPTFNSGLHLYTCLKAIKKQLYKNIEVIIVDNNSSDSTSNIAVNFGAKVLIRSSTMTQARNLGVKSANGEYVVLLDSDMELSVCVISDCIKKVCSGYDGVIIPERIRETNFLSKCISLEKALYKDELDMLSVRFVSKSAFNAIGGLDENLVSGEDYDFLSRFRNNGFKLDFVSSFFYHNEPNNFRIILKKKYNYGKTLINYFQKYPKKGFNQFVLRKPFLKIFLYYSKDPLHYSGLVLLKSIEYISAFFGFLSSIRRRL